MTNYLHKADFAILCIPKMTTNTSKKAIIVNIIKRPYVKHSIRSGLTPFISAKPLYHNLNTNSICQRKLYNILTELPANISDSMFVTYRFHPNRKRCFSVGVRFFFLAVLFALRRLSDATPSGIFSAINRTFN